MLNNKKLNIVISLVIAICLWAYVIGETNPIASMTFKDVPISLINEETLTDSGLAVLEVSDEVMNVTVTGTRADVNHIRKGEIIATVDLAEAAKGSNELKINIHVPDSVEVESKSLNKVTVVVEERKSKNADVEVDYSGSFPSDQEPITVELSKEKVKVSGAKTQIDKVDYVRATIDGEQVTDKMKTLTSKLTAVDKKGNEVKNVKLSEDTVRVTTVLAKTKTVNLSVPIVDRSGSQAEKATDVPKTITIKGQSEDIDQIDQITAREIDITNVTKDTTIDIVPILPEGVQVSAHSQNLTVFVKVSEIVSETFTFDGGDVKLTGLGADLEADVRTGKIEITLMGAKDILNAIDTGDFKLSADLSGLHEGTHQVDLTAQCEKDYTSIEIKPAKIRVTITVKEE